MKKTLLHHLASFITVTIAMTAVTGCKDDDLNVIGEVVMPEDANLVQLTAASYTIPFEIKSDTEWKIEFDGELAYAYPSEGVGNSTVKLCIQANLTGEDREGEMNVIFPKAPEKNRTYRLVQPYAYTLDGAMTSNSRYAVGFGYNIAEEYASPHSVKGEILKYQELFDKGLIENNNSSANFHTEIITGSSAIEVANELKSKASYASEFGNAFSGEVGASFNTSLFAKNEYEYALTIANVERHDLRVNINREELFYYMTDGAYNAINGLRKKRDGSFAPSNIYTNDHEGVRKLIQDYGTHLIMKARLGGRLTYGMSADLSKIEGDFELTAYAKMSYKNSLVVKAEGSAEISDSLKAAFKRSQNAINIRINVKGGGSSAVSALSEYGKDTDENINKWKQTLEDVDNCSLVDLIGDDCMIPIWELVDPDEDPDGTRRNAIREYFDNHFLNDYPSVAMSYSNGTAVHITKIPDFNEKDVTGSLVKDVYNNGQHVARICNEYIPVINKFKRVTVIYPVINNKTKWNMGYFIGEDGSHSPARVCWSGDNLIVTELDSKAPLVAAKDIYIRGSQFSNHLTSSDFPIVNGSIQDFVFVDKSHDPTSMQKVSHNYSLVKIFTRLWTREDYSGIRGTYNGGYYFCAIPGMSVERPKWFFPYSEDFNEIFGTLSTQNISHIPLCRAFFPDADGGVLGFSAKGYVRLRQGKLEPVSSSASSYGCWGYKKNHGKEQAAREFIIGVNDSKLTDYEHPTGISYVSRFNSSIYDN